MEKQAANSKPRNKILKLLPKAAGAVVSYQNLPFSPNRDNRSSDYNHPNKLPPRAAHPPHHHHHHHHYHFSGPMIPEEARKKSKNDETIDQEPTSPKVSCMGQIKQRHKEKKNKIKKATIKNNKKSFSLPKDIKQPSSSSSLVSPGHELKKQASKIRRIFTISKHSRSKSNVYADDCHHHENNNIESPVQLPERAPGLSQLRRFASGHSVLADFDWTAQITPVDSDHRNYYSDEERGNSDEEEHEEVIIPFSAPMMIGGGEVALQPRNEINLWKRRTMNPPRPLQLNQMIKAKS